MRFWVTSPSQKPGGWGGEHLRNVKFKFAMKEKELEAKTTGFTGSWVRRFIGLRQGRSGQHFRSVFHHARHGCTGPSILTPQMCL